MVRDSVGSRKRHGRGSILPRRVRAGGGAAKGGVTADQAAAVLEAAGTTTWHHFEKPPAGANLVALPLFAAG